MIPSATAAFCKRLTTVGLLVILSIGVTTFAQTNNWVTLTGCKFLAEAGNDGDSFHVKYGQREFIFRLYFIDAPETDTKLKDRVKEQCEYFGVTQEQLLKVSQEAKKFTTEWLKQPFIIKTRWQNAQGRSRLPRHYAFIEVGGSDLAARLVSYGLARAKGTVAIPPSGGKAKDHMEKLKQLEAEAKSKHLGIWAHSSKSAETELQPSR